jgi:hypothetical protein
VRPHSAPWCFRRPGHALRNGGSTDLPPAPRRPRETNRATRPQLVCRLVSAPKSCPGRALQRRRLHRAAVATPSGRALCTAAPQSSSRARRARLRRHAGVPGEAVSGKDLFRYRNSGTAYQREAVAGARARQALDAGPRNEAPPGASELSVRVRLPGLQDLVRVCATSFADRQRATALQDKKGQHDTAFATPHEPVQLDQATEPRLAARTGLAAL